MAARTVRGPAPPRGCVGRPEEIIGRARRRVIDRHLITGTEVPAGDALDDEVLAELSASLDRHLRKTVKHFRRSADLNILLRRLHGHPEAAAEGELSDFDLAMLAAGAPVPPDVAGRLGVGPEPWHPEHHQVESD